MAGFFTVGKAQTRVFPAVIEQIRDGVGVVSPGGGEGFVVGENEQPVIRALFRQGLGQGPHHPAVQPLDGLEFAGEVPVVGALVRGLHVDGHKVLAAAQFLQAAATLPS